MRRFEDGAVVLRDITEADGEAIFQPLTTDPDIAYWTRIPWPYTRAHLHDFMALVGRARRSRTDVVLAIAEPVDERLLGCIGIHRIGAPTVPRSALLPDEIGYWIAKEARNRGLVTRAVRLLSAYALAELGVERINLQTKVGNVASQHVAMKAGYRYVHRVLSIDVDDDSSDHDRFVMTRDDYERAHGALELASGAWTTSSDGSAATSAATPTATGSASASAP